MKKWFGRFILKIAGWEIVGTFPEHKKYIMIVCPHTSYWDYIWGQLSYFTHGKTVRMVIKKEYFKFPFKRILLKTGSVPINRGYAKGTIEELLKIIKDADDFILIITPEGTREKNKNWKSGFYYISEKAEIPIIMGKIDYKYKKLIIMGEFIKTGNVAEDMKKIKSYYKDANPKFPEKFSAED